MDGDGVALNRVFPSQKLRDFDPFLLLDELGPSDLAPGEARGFPDHPHRGFETVTYVLEGQMEHRDSKGNAGKIGPGDVQWMTAGSGVIHSEMPGRELAEKGGRLHGFQLWVNLPRKDKMMKPRYQEIPAAKIPDAVSKDGKVRAKVIAGETLGVKAVIETRTPIFYFHFTLKPGGRISQPVPKDFSAFAYVVSGEGAFGSGRTKAVTGQLALFDNAGESADITAPDSSREDLIFLLVGGAPLKEPVARYGPFVMNTPAEIQQAIDDYSNGRLG